jgi:xanthine/uracil/vitamin C permease (AzgA family)
MTAFAGTSCNVIPHATDAQVLSTLQVLGSDVPVSKALAGCMVAAGVVGLLAVLHVLSVVLGVVPDSIKLAVVSLHCDTILR